VKNKCDSSLPQHFHANESCTHFRGDKLKLFMQIDLRLKIHHGNELIAKLQHETSFSKRFGCRRLGCCSPTFALLLFFRTLEQSIGPFRRSNLSRRKHSFRQFRLRVKFSALVRNTLAERAPPIFYALESRELN
jgi:hypothetical protein